MAPAKTLREARGYGIGERAFFEDPETERRRTLYWNAVKSWAFRPGGKY